MRQLGAETTPQAQCSLIIRYYIILIDFIVISLLMSSVLGTGFPYGSHIRKTAITLNEGPVRIGGCNDCKCSRD
jgi:hypothetical protein